MNLNKLSLIAAAAFFMPGCKSKSDFQYFGQTPPGNTPELFAPGIISLDDRNESMITFSPDGMECYFTEHHEAWNWCKVNQLVCSDTGWSKAVKAPFSNDYSMCPSISSDGTKLFLASSVDKKMKVFEFTRTANGDWSKPVEMDAEISSGTAEYSCHPSSLGSMFVCSWRSGAVGGCDGWRIPQVGGHYQKAENLGLLNSVVGDCVWAPGPDEKYLIFQSRRPAHGNGGGFFETDLYITFTMPNGGWSQPQNLGPQINSSSTDGYAWVTHDGKYLFFSSNRRGTYDIYWVSLDSIVSHTPKLPLIATNHKPGEQEFYQKYQDKTDSITTLYFDLSQKGLVELTVCDRAGKKLKTVLEKVMEEGKNQFAWQGEGFDKGEYLCALRASDPESKEPFMETTIQILLR